MLAKKIALGFGIAIILPLLVYYGVSTFHPAPRWRDHLRQTYYREYAKATPEERLKLDQASVADNEKFQLMQKGFQQTLFIVAVPVGLLSILLGAFLTVQAIGTGLMFGGIFTVVEGYATYWSQLPDHARFLSLLAAFMALIFVGYRKLNK